MKTSLSVISKCVFLCMLILFVQQSAFSQISFVNSGQQLGINAGPGQGQYSATTGDINGDGKPDAIAANWIGLIDVHINTGGGIMSTYQIAGFSQTWSSLALADIDKDGDLDLLAGYEAGTNGGLLIFKNNGAGVFTNMAQSNLIGTNKSANTVSVGDVDGDGDVDALIGSRWNTVPTILLNNGSGAFSPGFNFSYSGFNGNWMCIGSALVDVDADGDLDALLSNSATMIVYKNNGAGVFTQASDIMIGYKPSSKQYDLDGDGDLDLVMAYNGNFNVYKNDGAGNFTLSQALFHSGLNPWGKVAVGDLDGDGDKDIYASSLGTTDPDAIFANNGSGSFCKVTVANLNILASTEPEIADFNADGKQDVFVPNLQPGFDAIYFNTSTGPFVNPTVSVSSNSPITPGSTLSLTATGTFSTWTWTGPNAFASTVQNPNITNASTAATGTYNLTATDAGGCIATASTAVVVAAPPASALSFGGTNDYVDLGSILPANASYTKEGWIYSTDASSLNNLFSTNGDPVYMPSGKINVGQGNNYSVVADPDAFPMNQWVHVAITYDKPTTTLKLYVNGVLKASNTNAPAFIGGLTYLGQHPGGGGQSSVKMDEVRFWSRALCQAELLNNMNCELNPVGQSGLVALYHFNQGFLNTTNNVSTLTDASGNGKNGTLVGFLNTGSISNWVAGSNISGTCSVFTSVAANITGTASACVSGTSSLTASIAGGRWSSSNTAVATVSASGVVSGLSAGSATITYTTECGAVSTVNFTVNALPVVAINNSNPSICAGASSTLSTQSDLVAYWKFNEGAGSTVADVSGNNLNGTFTGSLGWSASSPFAGSGSALSINGGGYAVVNDHPAFAAMQNKMTIEAWVYQTDNVNNAIVDKGNYNFLFMTNPNGQPGLGFYNNSGGWSYSTTSVPVNQWVHLALTWDGATKTLKFYKNGVLTDTFIRPSGLTFDNGPLNIGRQSPTSCQCNIMNGNIDELRLWNVVKSAAEIQANMNASLVVSTPATYVWSPSTGLNTTTGNSVIANPNTTTTYTVTATNANGCVAITNSTVTVKQTSVPTIVTSGPTTFCEGGSVNLTAQNGGNALSFNGSNRVTVGNTPTIPVGNSTYTMEAWIKPNNVTGANGLIGWGSWGSTNQVNAFRFNGPTTLINYWWANDLYVTIPNVLDGKWHHVAATYNGTTRAIYFDGVLMGSDQPSGHNVTAGTALYIAETYPAGNEYFNGSMDEVRIWNTGKTQAQIQASMNATVPVNSTGLVAYYKLDETSGLTAADATGNGNNGTLTANPVWMVPSTSILGGSIQSVLWNPGGATTNSISVSNAGTYTATVTDVNGCTATSAPVVVTVNPKPTANISTASPLTVCLGGAVLLDASTNSNDATYQWFRNGAPIPNATNASFNAIVSGSYTVVVASASGCVSNPSNALVVTIEDIIKPFFSSVGSITTSTNAQGQVLATSAQGAVVTYNAPVGADNCTVVSNVLTAGFASGSVFPIGTTTVTYTVTDGAGLTETSSFDVVVSGLAPVVVVPANITVNVDENTCGAAVSFAATDNTGIPASTITYTENGQPVVSGASFSTGLHTITATATNAVGSSSASFTITVIDNQLPVISAPANISVIATSAQGAMVTYVAPVGTDNCSATTVRTAGLASGSTFPIGVTTVTYTVTDASGNTASASFTVTVSGLAPVIVVPEAITQNNDAGQCGASVSFAATETTAIPASTIVYTENGQTIVSGHFFSVGTHTITATATNAVGSSSADFTITVIDAEKPTITVAAQTQSADAGVCKAFVTVASPVIADNCAVASVVNNITGTNNASAVYPVGTTTITWTVTDIHGNITTATQDITVKDEEKPIVLTQNITVQLNASGAASIAAAQINNGSTDNCGIASITIDKTSFYCSNVGANTVTLTVTDIHGNVNTATAVVTVQDKIAPVALAKNITVGLSAVGGTVSITAADVNNGSSDACGIASMTVVPASFSCANIGANTVTLTVTDVNGNVSSTTAIVTVVDDKGPVPTAVLPVISGQCYATALTLKRGEKAELEDGRLELDHYYLVAPTAFDNCSGLVKGTTTDPLTYYNQGTYIIHWKFVDARGNVTIQEQTVIVKDTEAPRPKYASLPTITGQCSVSIVNTNNSDDDGDHEGREGDDHEGDEDENHYDEHQRGAPWAKDNCSGWIRGTTTDPLTYSVQGTYIIHWTFNDGHGNISTQTQTVIVADVTKPKIKAPNDKTVTCGSNTAPAVMGTATATDNCSVPVISYTDVNSGTQIVRTWRATDAAGNFSTDVQVIKLTTAFSGTVVSVPTSTVYTGGEVNNLYLGYGAQGTALTVTGLPSSGAPYTYSWTGVATNRLSATNTGAPVFSPIAGGVYTFTVTMTNKNGCSNTASISICVTDIRVPGSNGALVYVCHKGNGKTGGTKTLEVPVAQVASHIQTGSCGGKNDRLGSCDQNPCNSGNSSSAVDPKQLEEPIEVKPELKAAPVVVEELKVVVMPNPTTTYFTIRLESKDKAPVNLRVMDGSGRVIDAKQKMEPNSSFQMGHGYSSGTYYAEFIQGNKRKVIQLIKGRG